MKPFEHLTNAVVLNRRNAQSLYEVVSRLLTHRPVRFTCNASVVDDNGQTGHHQRVLAVLRERNAIEIIGVDFVTYRIPYGARVEIGEADLRVEMRNIVPQRQDCEHIQWQFVVQDDADVVGIPIPSDDSNPLGLLHFRMAWPLREEDCLHILRKSRFEMEVAA